MSACSNPDNTHFTVYSSEDPTVPLGFAAIRRGYVAPGELALVCGETYERNYVARISYCIEDGSEFVRLERLDPEGVIESCPRSAVELVGQVVCLKPWGERCEECLAMRTVRGEETVRRVLGEAHVPRALSPRARPAQKRKSVSRARDIRRKVEEMTWPEVIDV